MTFVGLACLLLGACQAPRPTIGKFQRSDGELRVILMPVDIELSVLNASGLLEPNAEWTQKAKVHVTSALTETFQSLNARLTPFVPANATAASEPARQQLINLHSAVGFTAVRQLLVPNARLLHKKGKVDWTLGKSVAVLRENSDAQYALFVYIRDSYASDGRVAVQVLGALLGAAVRGGTQTAFASLVDLKSGKIVWFNVVARSTGDLREFRPAKSSVVRLMHRFPK